MTTPAAVTGILVPTGERWPLASTQLHFAMEGFDFVRIVTPSEPDASAQSDVPGPEAEPTPGARAPTFYPVYDYDSPSWGMSIDLDTCIGCNACVVGAASDFMPRIPVPVVAAKPICAN